MSAITGAYPELDPTRLRPLDIFGEIPLTMQGTVSAVIAAMNLPVYFTVDVEDEDKAARLLDQLSSRIVLEGSPIFGLPTQFDAYRLPDYQGHKSYVLSYQFYALKLRLHV